MKSYASFSNNWTLFIAVRVDSRSRKGSAKKHCKGTQRLLVETTTRQ